MGVGWGTFFGRAADWFPSKKERYLAKIKQAENRMEKIAKKKPLSTADSRAYAKYGVQLRNYTEKLKRI